MDNPDIPPLRLDGSNTRVEVIPVDLAGAAHRQPEARAFPFALHGPAVVSLYFDRGPHGISVAHTFLIVRNAAGAEIALVRLRP